MARLGGRNSPAPNRAAGGLLRLQRHYQPNRFSRDERAQGITKTSLGEFDSLAVEVDGIGRRSFGFTYRVLDAGTQPRPLND